MKFNSYAGFGVPQAGCFAILAKKNVKIPLKSGTPKAYAGNYVLLYNQ